MKNIALLGDSLIELMPYKIDENMPRGFGVPMQSDKLPKVDAEFYIYGISNIGIGTYHNYVWKSVNKVGVDYFVLLIGINNILRPDCDYDGIDSLESVIEKLKKFILEIKDSGSNILVECLYPTSMPKVNEAILYVNSKLRELCQKYAIEYLDLYEILSDENGFLNSDYTDDGLHPNELAYNIIINKICQKLNLNKVNESYTSGPLLNRKL